MTNPEIAAVFDEVADILEFQDANPFRVRAYRNAARTIREMGEPLEDVVEDPDRDLTEIPGIGKDLAEKISTLIRSGSLPMLEELLAEVPESVLAMLRVPGLGPKRAAVLYKELKVKDLDQLREAALGQDP
jgi:DNA polymerase (family 10)